MELHKAPVAEVGMLIRKPAAEVYEAFIDPAVTSKFWFTHGSARLDAGRQVEWEWRMYDFKSPVEVRELVKAKKIVVGWGEARRCFAPEACNIRGRGASRPRST